MRSELVAEDDDQKYRERLHDRTRAELDAAGRSNAENYDRALLTLSSAFLGGSLALTSQVIDLNAAAAKWMLYLSWLFFAITIILTLTSYLYSLLTLQWLRDAATRYYIRLEKDARDVSDKVRRAVERFLIFCGVSFAIGVLLLGSFIAINIAKENTVSQKPVTPKWNEHSIPPGTFQKPVTPQPAPQPATPAPTAPTKEGS